MKALRTAGFYLVAGLFFLWAVFPFYYAVVTSLKTGFAVMTPTLWPSAPSFANYVHIFELGFGRNVLNSVIVATLTVLVAGLVSLLAAYALSRVSFRGRSTLLVTMLGATMFPQAAVLSGLFSVIRGLGLYNTWWGLIFSYLLFTVPFTVWVLTAFMRELPQELEEAAIIDGAGPWVIVTRIFLPLLAPAMAATGLLAFIAAWNEFLFALTFTLDNTARTVPVAITVFGGSSSFMPPYGNIMAASAVVSAPLVVLVLVFQRWITSGLTMGAVKG